MKSLLSKLFLRTLVLSDEGHLNGLEHRFKHGPLGIIPRVPDSVCLGLGLREVANLHFYQVPR